MTGWFTALRDRPIAEQERHTALAATAAVLITTTVLFALTRPATHAATGRATAKVSATSATVGPDLAPEARRRGALSREAAATSRAFLAGYLAYTYSGAPAGRITDAARSLIASLQAHPPRVSPAMRASRPRVLELHITPASSGQLGVSAVVNAGGLIDYTIGLTLAREDGRLLVTALEQS
jgi:hypothetical protein